MMNKFQMLKLFKYAFIVLFLLLEGCADKPLNSPYSSLKNKNVFYSSFQERPKHLDPARSYSSNEYAFIAQIYEPLFQYHYLEKPYKLIPLTAERMPVVKYLDKNFVETNKSNNISYTKYIVNIKKGIMYQDHPAFYKKNGQFIYHNLSKNQLKKINSLKDFTHESTRELIAKDYVYQIKRLSDKKNHSPIAGVMQEYIYGFSEYRKKLTDYKDNNYKNNQNYIIDNDIAGIKVINRYSFSIILKKQYPQFIYWLAMPFFSPMPWEADIFYGQEPLKEKNITLNWYPVGTGPFKLTENNPNLRMVLEKNKNFRGEVYPSLLDKINNGKLISKNKDLVVPFIEKAIYSLEKEQIPRWNKFLQGYYDNSGIASDNYDQAVSLDKSGDISLTEDLKDKGIHLATATAASTYYIGFNMLDSVIGGSNDRARLLRQALTIAIDYDEYISIFANGRGILAQSPIPPGIFGYQDGTKEYNHTVFQNKNNLVIKKSIKEAKILLKKAGYKDGIDERTGKPLILYFEATGSGADTYAFLNWLRKQFKKINIQLVTRVTDYNRFQEKMINGTGQIFQWGWNADYPDPENFLFLLYSKNGKVKFGGENASNYSNYEFDKLFLKMKNMENSDNRENIIKEMLKIIQYDCPWIWGFHPKSFSLSHEWFENVESNLMANNTLKYNKINDNIRSEKIKIWNKANFTLMYILLVLLVSFIISVLVMIKKKDEEKVL
ncbi:MAG: ABC transporter substrate-binding protein [Gammaproteobacteria bacterium]|jgi:oligopeptide transport system substrate-binding protein|nr:ABC transporter substrate-binding protein [Gammaproteobacteria bacterium]MBT7603240.1 ABC transporter substrate-binding protein [Gammaproteobacteria bacterium]